MALNIQNIYEWVNFAANKMQSGEITDSQFNTACQFVNLDLFRQLSGVPENYQPNNPIPPISWQITSTISDDLRQLVKKATLTKSGDYFAFPTDYAAFSSIAYKYILNQPNSNPTVESRWIELVTDDELHQRLPSAIKPPTLFYPIAAYYLQGFQVFPSQINKIELTYLKVPNTPIRNFTQLANDQTEYNPTGSVQFEYPETLYPNIAARIALQLGISIREEQFVEYMKQRQAQGN